MADPLDLLARDYRETAGALDVADRNRTWAKTFSSTPRAEVLRANQDYENLMQEAIAKKQDLLRVQAPLKDQLTIAQIDHQKAMTARDHFKAVEDQRLSQQADDFYSGLADLKKQYAPDSTEYQTGLLDLIHKNHEAVRRDPGMQQELRNSAQSMQDKSYWTRFNQSFKEASVLARSRGVDVQYVDGEPSIQATKDYADSLGTDDTNPGKSKTDPVARELLTLHKMTPSELLNPISVQYGNRSGEKFVPDADGRTGGKIAQIDIGRGNPVEMSASEYARYKQAFTPKEETSQSEIKTQAEYNALPAGAEFTFNGKRGKKPEAK